jgi:hypothetical protein
MAWALGAAKANVEANSKVSTSGFASSVTGRSFTKER